MPSFKLVNFLKEVKLESAKVNWPTKNQTIKYTLAVIGISLVIAVFLGGIDKILQFVLNTFIL
ncbi:MAG: preprotein translocase subunit SecE [bacterium]